MTEAANDRRQRGRRRLDGLASAAILLLAGILRFTGLNWDLAQWIHPDEGHMRAITAAITWPEDLGDYFNTPVSTLNPRNSGQTYSYGTLPLFANRAVAEWLDSGCGDDPSPAPQWVAARILARIGHPPPSVEAGTCGPGTFTWTYSAYVGRHLSALADLGTVALAGLLTKRLYTRRAALLAMATAACTALLVQQAHFYTVDAAATFFTTLTALLCVHAAGGRRPVGAASDRRAPWLQLAAAGFCVGLATACKVSSALSAGLVALAGLVWARRSMEARGEVGNRAGDTLKGLAAATARVTPALALAAVLALVAFRVAQPYAFEGPGLFGVSPDPEWFGRLAQISEEQSGTIDYPSGRQWTNRMPVLFPLRNMVNWGFGIPLGLATLAGWAFCGWRLARGDRRLLVPWVWTTAFFAFYATRWVKAMRYFLPIYPLLITMAGDLLDQVLSWAQAHRPNAGGQGTGHLRLARAAALCAVVAVLIGTIAWGTGMAAIYVRPHTRVAASRWIYSHVPHGSTLANEHWDWGLPLRIDGMDGFRAVGTGPTYTGFNMEHYNEDTPEKREQLLTWLDQADYIILASNRLYGSIARLPQRYPMTTTYYAALFDGSLGFRLAAEFTSYLSLGPVVFPDQETPFWLMEAEQQGQPSPWQVHLTPAEESFSVYDHPNCLIFRKTDTYSHARAAEILYAADLRGALAWQSPQDATRDSVAGAHAWTLAGLLALTAAVTVGGLLSADNAASELELKVVKTTDLDDVQRQELVTLCNHAYEEDLTDAVCGLSGTHVLGYLGPRLVTHGMWVTRRLQIEDGPPLQTAYIEMVATDAGHRRRGYAAAVMRRIADLIAGYDLAALSPFSTTYYGRLGWETWQGTLLIRKDDQRLPTPEDEEVMILRLPRSPDFLLTDTLSVEWREGEVW